MGLFSVFKDMFVTAETKAVNEIDHPTLQSSRLWLTIGLIGGLIWISHGLLTDHNLNLAFAIAAVYMVTNTITRVATIMVNGKLRLQSNVLPTVFQPYSSYISPGTSGTAPKFTTQGTTTWAKVNPDNTVSSGTTPASPDAVLTPAQLAANAQASHFSGT